MKVLYVGDNRNRVNWGCRATSIALKALIEEAGNTIVSTIDGKEVAPYSYTASFFPGVAPTKLLKAIYMRRNRKIFDVLYRLLSSKRQIDFIEDDVSTSTKQFLEIKKHNVHLEKIYEQIKLSDAIVINGEGDFILSNPPRRNALFYLFMLDIAKKMGKKTFLVNAMFSDCPATGRNDSTLKETIKTLNNCTLISTRDNTSYNYLKELNITSQLICTPDALFTWQKYFQQPVPPPTIGDAVIPFPEEDRFFNTIDFSKPYIIISGSSSAAQKRNEAIKSYTNLTNRVKELHHQVYLQPTCIGDSFLDHVSIKTNTPILPLNMAILTGASVLANAELMISGRFHPSILASLGGTPCIFLGSNSHKTKSLQDLLEYDNPKEYSAIPNQDEIESILLDAKYILDDKDNIRERIRGTVKRRAAEAKKIRTYIC